MKNFCLQLSKCHFRQAIIRYLGHLLSRTELRPNPDTIAAIAKAPSPQNPQQLSSFLGLVNVYTEFLYDLATIAELLHVLGRKGVAFVWDDICQQAFLQIKKMISEDLVLALYDPNALTFLLTDALGVGISTVLSQMQNVHEVMVACASHTFQPAECNYSMVEQEGLTCVWGAEKFECFLWGHHFTVRTDQWALTFLFQVLPKWSTLIKVVSSFGGLSAWLPSILMFSMYKVSTMLSLMHIRSC